MLEKLGFKAQDHVDPFDGGPYLQASRDDIPIVRYSVSRSLAGASTTATHSGVVSCVGEFGFRAIRSDFMLTGDSVRLPSRTIATLGASTRASIGLTAFDKGGNAIDMQAKPLSKAKRGSRGRG